jgi:anti-sigma B factor antagonist
VSSLRLESERSADVLHLRLGGELDLAGVPQLEQGLGDQSDSASTIVLDLREVDFIDSSGIRAILMADRQARASGRRCVVVRGPESVDRVFRITGLNERLEVVEDPAEV